MSQIRDQNNFTENSQLENLIVLMKIYEILLILKKSTQNVDVDNILNSLIS